MNGLNLLEPTEDGLYCPAGDFFIDAWRPVDRVVVTHAHGDHACRGCGRYLTSRDGEQVLRVRMGQEAVIDTAGYGDVMHLNGVQVSLHPAGHILGSAQVRLEHEGMVWVVSGDYKVEPDATCAPFEPVKCHVFVSESTFGLPIYRWPKQADTFEAIRAWWRGNQEAGKASVLFAYALGKAQRLIAGLGTTVGPIYTHGAVEALNEAYRKSGVALPETRHVSAASAADWSRSLIVAPPSAQGTLWLRRFGPISTGFASGWMRIRGLRRRRSVDRGFVLSDHADWPGLLAAIDATGADQVWLTHGYSAVVARWLR
ncbi:MAG TPA: ligase-associated DNA damage response exonuclease, partial [Isosphaeraceae bacterium]|nr:ligase-associated DNA damage response exonuclease [Isosphaeraceae bacterium]